MKVLAILLLFFATITLTMAHPDKNKPPKPPSKCDDYPCRGCCIGWSACIQQCNFFHANPRRCKEQCQEEKCKGSFEFCRTDCHFEYCEPEWADKSVAESVPQLPPMEPVPMSGPPDAAKSAPIAANPTKTPVA